MGPRITTEKKQAIIEMSKTTTLSQRQIAYRVGVSRSSVYNILSGNRPKKSVTANAGFKPRESRQIEFRQTAEYYCKVCNAKVGVRPCPACLARRAAATVGKSSVSEIQEPKQNPPMDRERIAKYSKDGLCKVAIIPPPILRWFSKKLAKMIGRSAKPEEVEESVFDFTEQLHGVLSATASRIAQERREQNVQRRVG